MKPLKIIEICPFGSKFCGIGYRVINESMELNKRGHEIKIISSNIEKTTYKKAPKEEIIEGIKIQRVGCFLNSIIHKFLSKNVVVFNPISILKKLIKETDIIICHSLQPFSFISLIYAKLKKKPIIIITHAPFEVRRKFPLNIITSIYYFLIVNLFLKKFDKVIAISKWEIKHLKNLNIPEEKIEFIPNGLLDDYFEK